MSDSEEDYVPKKRPASASKRSAQDSSDDDMPIAQLAKKHKKAVPRIESDSDDDVLLTDLSKKPTTKPKPKPKPKAKPTSATKAKPKATPAKSAAAKKLVTKKAPAKKAPPAKSTKAAAGKATKAKSPVTKKKAAAKKEQDQAPGEKLVTRSSVLYETKKGEMVQKLLCRWWYAMEWPAKEDITPAPPLYEALEGYPGVYIGVEGDEIGELMDVRNKSTCPCFSNFSKKNSGELKELLEVAFTKQKEAFVEHWGQNNDEEAKLNRELKWLKAVDPAKADKAAVRALSQANFNN